MGAANMKVKKFHQFIELQKGPVNTAIINFLTGDVYQVENTVIEKFNAGEYSEISGDLKAFYDAGLIIDIDQQDWIPRFEADNSPEDMKFPLILEAEAGTDEAYIEKISSYTDVSISFLDDKNFNTCKKKSKVSGDFNNINRDVYLFNKKYNSCWGNKIVLTAKGEIKPCIHSNLVVCDLREHEPEEILEKLEKYHYLTKDKVEKCKDCELRYICFDCREIAFRENGDLHSPNPYCNYDPYNGTWKE